MRAANVLARLPLAFDLQIYREQNRDLQSMTDGELQRHYDRYGMEEGRRCHSISDRLAFAALAEGFDALEIGPFNKPLLQGPNVRYFDVLDRPGLLDRAKRLGRPPERVPERIHFVSPNGDLSVVDTTFDAILSSHVVEHQPDLVSHLRAIERLLRPGGAYLLLVPDKRYCFDYPHAPSTIADVLDAHYEKRVIHTLQSQLEHEAMTTHSDEAKYWAGQSAEPVRVVERAAEVLSRYRAEPGAYIDVHAWYFTPTSFSEIIGLLRELGLISLRAARVYPTLNNHNEFWAALEFAPR